MFLFLDKYIVNQNKHNTLGNLLRFFKNFFYISIIAATLFSCTDNGCIEADDFGEYETQTLEVVANSNTDSCIYNPAKSITDSSQGSELKKCFTSGDVTIYDENKETQSSSSGCNGLPSDKFKNLCISQCVNECSVRMASGVSSAEPAWNSTSKKYSGRNGGVNIVPDSEVSIRAIGLINLGDKFEYPDFFIRGDQFQSQSYKKDWSSQVLDLQGDKTLLLSFSGQIDDGSFANGGTTKVDEVGAGNSSKIDNRAYNASRRLVAYLIPHPDNYDFDTNQTSEREGSINVPLLPDANMWQCEYSGTDLNNADCKNKSYKNNGYAQANDELVSAQFPITSLTESSNLGEYGGLIRWKDDGLLGDKFDPFKAVNCDSAACSGASEIDSALGRIVGDLSGGDVVIKPVFSSKVSFKNLLSTPVCDGEIQVSVRSAEGSVTDISSGAIAINRSVWSPQYISVEAGQELVIKKDDSKTYMAAGGSVNCGKALAVKFAKYHDIKIEKSGFVSFAILNAAVPDGCMVNARIINPTGRHVAINNNFSADFYEYENFSVSTDILNNFNVPGLSALTVWDDGTSINGSKKVFVRKGQSIRFSPESWDGAFNSSGGVRKCGIGMAMKIEPRPALLCRGYKNDNVANPKCVFKYTDGKLTGCSEYAAECDDVKSNLGAYCPNAGCLKPLINCTLGSETSSPAYTTTCSLGPRPDECSIADKSTYTKENCDKCSENRLANAQQSPYVSETNMVQCYDLEEYQGKVSNIPLEGFDETQLKDKDLARGAKELGGFNGEYGDLELFRNNGKRDSVNGNNTILELQQSITTRKPGRLKFIFLDGEDFLNIQSPYSDNTSAGDKYNGANGFKIGISSTLEFKNGEWLEVILCAETSDKTVDCKSLSEPKQIEGQPELVRLQEPVIGEFKSKSKTPFSFDQYGSILRTGAAPLASDCQGIHSGDNFYCHTQRSIEPSLIKLSFKIKDPEFPNCNIANPVQANATTTNNTTTNTNDGIIVSNGLYHANDCNISDPNNINPSVKNGIIVLDSSNSRVCVSNPDSALMCQPSDGADCKKEFRCVSRYTNNSGKYFVVVRIKKPSSDISKIVGDVVNPVVEVMDGKKDKSTIGQAERIYLLIVGDVKYQAILSMSIIIMLTFYGLTYLMGMHEAGIGDIINKMIKISVIYLFVGPEGWYWFDAIVVKTFKNGTDYLSFLMASSFDESPDLQRAIDNFDFYDKSILFGSVDKVFGLIFSKTVHNKILALLFASFFGWAYLMIIYYGILAYIYAVANAVLLYLTAQVFISVLFVLGPLFFILALFDQTKEMFDKWLSQLIGYSLQQVFLLTTLAFFNMMMYEVIKMSLGYKVCWDEVWTINIVNKITLLSSWRIASMPAATDSQSDVGNIGNNDGIPSFFVILFIWVIAELMLSFITFMTGIAAEISGGLSISSLAGGVKSSINAIRQSDLGKLAGKAWDNSVGRATQEADRALFDSGKLAHDDRIKKRQEMSQTIKQKSSLSSAGKKAMNDFKKKHGAEMTKMSKEKQEETLREVKNAAMFKKGKEMGLSKEQVEALKKEKSFKYAGDNLLGAAANAAYQRIKEGGSISKSIDNRRIDTDFTKKEARAALKNTDKQGRSSFVEAAKRGDVYVKGIFSKSSKDKYTSKEYKDATDELVREGEVSDMRRGTGWSRPDVEKEKIRKRMKKNHKMSESSKPKTRLGVIADLEVQRRMEDGGDPEIATDESWLKKKYKVLGREWRARREIRKGDKDKGIVGLQEAREQSEIQDLSKAEMMYGSTQSAIENNDKEIEKIEKNDKFKEKQERFVSAMATATNPKLTDDEKSEARETLRELDEDEEFSDQKLELKERYANRNENQAALVHYAEQIKARKGKIAKFDSKKSAKDLHNDEENGGATAEVEEASGATKKRTLDTIIEEDENE